MKIKDIVFATIFAIGALLTGSDGPWFPWINIIGVCLYGITLIFSSKEKRVHRYVCHKKSFI